jgi:hypothetical protein
MDIDEATKTAFSGDAISDSEELLLVVIPDQCGAVLLANLRYFFRSFRTRSFTDSSMN